MKVNVYRRPHGSRSIVNMSNIHSETEEFFEKNSVVISIEQESDNVIICYAEVEWIQDFSVIHLSIDEACESAMDQLKENSSRR